MLPKSSSSVRWPCSFTASRPSLRPSSTANLEPFITHICRYMYVHARRLHVTWCTVTLVHNTASNGNYRQWSFHSVRTIIYVMANLASRSLARRSSSILNQALRITSFTDRATSRIANVIWDLHATSGLTVTLARVKYYSRITWAASSFIRLRRHDLKRNIYKNGMQCRRIFVRRQC